MFNFKIINILLLLLAIASPSLTLADSKIKSQWSQLQQRFDKHDSIALYPANKLPILSGLVKVVSDPQEGFLAAIMMMETAQYAIDTGTYIFKRDPIGYAYINKIKEALQRGVSVRIYVDSMGSMHPTHSELKALLAITPGINRHTGERASIDVVTFNSIWNVRFVANKWYRRLRNIVDTDANYGSIRRWRNRRSHDKMLGIDLEHYHLAMIKEGGRNVSMAYYGLPVIEAHTYNDIEVIIRNLPTQGSVPTIHLGTIIRDYFEALFYHRGNKQLSPNTFSAVDHSEFKQMGLSITNVVPPGGAVHHKYATMVRQDYLNQGFSAAQLEFVTEIFNVIRHNVIANPDPKTNLRNINNENSAVENTRRYIQAAKKSITILSPYFYLDAKNGEVERLQKWLDADPERTLMIVTNSILTTDNLPAQGLVDYELARYFIGNPNWANRVVNGMPQARIFSLGKTDSTELGGHESYGKLHAKFFIVDGERGGVLTSNGDERSRKLNSEFGFIIHGKETAAQLQDYADHLISKSTFWGSPEWQKVRNHPKLRNKIRMEQMIYDCVKTLNLKWLI